MHNLVKKTIHSNKLFFNKEIALEYLNNSLELYYQVIDLYLTIYSDLEITLTKYILEKNYSEILKIVHKLKGTSMYTGCILLHEYTTYLHQKLFLKNYVNIINEIKLLIELNNKIIAYLKEEMDYEKRIINCK